MNHIELQLKSEAQELGLSLEGYKALLNQAHTLYTQGKVDQAFALFKPFQPAAR